jgi:uncharacterized protein YfbU (UPF0304 family)
MAFMTLSKSDDYLDEVRDVLIMFRVLGPAAKFLGFDGNTEAKHMSYARTLIENVKPWMKLKPADYDSYREMMPSYRRMLSKWRAAADLHKLTREEAASIVAEVPQDSNSLDGVSPKR